MYKMRSFKYRSLMTWELCELSGLCSDPKLTLLSKLWFLLGWLLANRLLLFDRLDLMSEDCVARSAESALEFELVVAVLVALLAFTVVLLVGTEASGSWLNPRFWLLLFLAFCGVRDAVSLVGDFGAGRCERTSGAGAVVLVARSTRGAGGAACTARLNGLADLEDTGCDEGMTLFLVAGGGLWGTSCNGRSNAGRFIGTVCTAKGARTFGGEGTGGWMDCDWLWDKKVNFQKQYVLLVLPIFLVRLFWPNLPRSVRCRRTVRCQWGPKQVRLSYSTHCCRLHLAAWDLTWARWKWPFWTICFSFGAFWSLSSACSGPPVEEKVVAEAQLAHRHQHYSR